MADSESPNVVTNGLQEKRKKTARQTVNCFKLKLPVKGYKRLLKMDTKTE